MEHGTARVSGTAHPLTIQTVAMGDHDRISATGALGTGGGGGWASSGLAQSPVAARGAGRGASPLFSECALAREARRFAALLVSCRCLDHLVGGPRYRFWGQWA